MNRLVATFLVVAVVAAALGAALAAADVVGSDGGDEAPVALSSVTSWTCPDGAAAATLWEGDDILLTGRTDDGEWVQVRDPRDLDDRVWLPREAVTVSADAEPLPVTSCGDDAGTAPEGEEVSPGSAPSPTTGGTTGRGPSAPGSGSTDERAAPGGGVFVPVPGGPPDVGGADGLPGVPGTVGPLPGGAPGGTGGGGAGGGTGGGGTGGGGTGGGGTSTPPPTTPPDTSGPLVFGGIAPDEIVEWDAGDPGAERCETSVLPVRSSVAVTVLDRAGVTQVSMVASVAGRDVPLVVEGSGSYVAVLGPFPADTIATPAEAVSVTVTATDGLGNVTTATAQALLVDCVVGP